MTEKTSNTNDYINPIDEDSITETPHSLTYGHHRGSFPVVPTEQGQIKSKALSSMEHQTDIQMLQIKQQMELLAQQAAKIQKRVDVSKQIYGAEIRFEPLINHLYHLYRKEDDKFRKPERFITRRTEGKQSMGGEMAGAQPHFRHDTKDYPVRDILFRA